MHIKRILLCSVSLYLCLVTFAMIHVTETNYKLVGICASHEDRIATLEEEVSELEVQYNIQDETTPEDIVFYDSIPLSEELQNFTYDICVDYGVEDHYELILAMMWQESNFNPNAVSATNDYGIMQINVCNHNWLRQTLGITNFLDAEQNITAGVHMISNLLHKYDTENKALMAYNLGEGGAAAKWHSGIYTTDYSEHILEKKEKVLNNMYI